MFGIGSKILAIAGGGLSAVLAIVLAFTIISKNSEIHSLKDSIEAPKVGWRARLDACNADRLTLKANQGTLEGSIGRQNSSIDNSVAVAATKYANGASDRLHASESAAAAATQEHKVAVQKPGADQCKSADALILENM